MPKTVSSTTLTLTGKDGYNNSLTALQAVADIYLNPAQSKSARSLTVDDINKVENHTPDGNVASITWTHRYGMDNNLNITDAGEGITPTQTYTSTEKTGSYFYQFSALKGMSICWLASRVVGFFDWSNEWWFGVRRWDSGDCVTSTQLVSIRGSHRRLIV